MWKRICKRIGKRLYQDERGNVSLIVAGALVLLLGSLALVADVGMIYLEKQRLYGALDSGALAGIQRIVFGEADAEEMAGDYVQKNGEQATTIVADPENLKIDLTGQKKVELGFAKVLGYEDANISVRVEAQAGPTVKGTGFVPIGVPDQTFQYGALYTLSQGSGSGTTGNYGYLDLAGNNNGGKDLEQFIEYGYPGTLAAGQQVLTETGTNVGNVSSAITARIQADSGDEICNNFQTAASGCKRILYLPVIDSLDVTGHKSVTILGFAAFYLESVSGGGGHEQINGRFIRTVMPGQMGQGTDYGLYSVKLTH